MNNKSIIMMISQTTGQSSVINKKRKMRKISRKDDSGLNIVHYTVFRFPRVLPGGIRIEARRASV